jgi:hypothetical protein
MSVDPVILEMRANIDQIKAQLRSLDVELKKVQGSGKKAGQDLETSEKDAGDEVEKTNKKLRTQEKETKGLSKAFKRLGGVIAAAFSVREVVRFVAEGVKMAAVARGVETAFKQTGASIQSLRTATRGTVSDLQLMQSAVQASNLGVPVEELGSLFEFATQRARETGESVDYLVNSIVTGLGRKSPLILDNLGISAVALREELGGVGLESASVADLTAALSRVIENDMVTAIDSGIDKTQQLSAAMENLQVAIGSQLEGPTQDIAGNAARQVNALSDALNNDFLNGFEKFAAIVAELALGEGQAAMAVFISDEEKKEIREQARIMEAMREAAAAADETLAREAAQRERANKGIIQLLKERIKDTNEAIEAAQSEAEISRLLERRNGLQEELNRLLGKTKDDLQDLNELDFTWLNNAFPTTVLDDFVKKVRTTNKEVDKLFEEAFEEQYGDQGKKIRDEIRARTDYAISEEQRLQQAKMDLIQSGFALAQTLANDNAEASKAVAIFQATIQAYLAINQQLASNPGPAAFIAAAAIGVQAFANVAAIAQQSVPQFFEGTNFVKSPSGGRNRDDVPAMLHHGEAVIRSDKNRKYKGLAKAVNEGKLHDWLETSDAIPAILSSKKRQKEIESQSFANNIANSLMFNFADNRMVSELKRNRLVNEAMLKIAKSTSKRKNPYRA